MGLIKCAPRLIDLTCPELPSYSGKLAADSPSNVYWFCKSAPVPEPPELTKANACRACRSAVLGPDSTRPCGSKC